jgi:uncharacterized protein (TIGR03435 family)
MSRHTAGVALLAVGVCLATPGAPSAQAPAPPAASFDVASVKPNKDGGPSSVRVTPGGMLSVTNNNLRNIIRNAWNITNDQIVGGPDWIDSERFDITAKASRPFSQDEARGMLKALLAERFGLVTRHETRELPVYVQGRRARPADEEERARLRRALRVGNRGRQDAGSPAERQPAVRDQRAAGARPRRR